MNWILSLVVLVSAMSASAVEKYCYDRERNGRERIETEAYLITEEPYFEYRTTVIDADGRRTQGGGILLDRRQHCGQSLNGLGCRYFTWDFGGNFKFEFKCGDRVQGLVEINRYGDAELRCQVAGQPPMNRVFRGCYR